MTMTRFLSGIFIGVFIISWVAAVLSWFYGIYEMIAFFRLKGSSYNIGKRVLEFTERLDYIKDSIRLNDIVKTQRCKYKFLELNKCIFREKWRASHILRLNTPFPLKGTVEFNDGKATVQGRVPLGMSIFLLAWLVGWSSGGIIVCINSNDFNDLGFSLLFTMIGWVIVFFMYFTALPLEKKRFLNAYGELKHQLGSIQ
jgi:hypothetical protein